MKHDKPRYNICGYCERPAHDFMVRRVDTFKGTKIECYGYMGQDDNLVLSNYLCPECYEKRNEIDIDKYFEDLEKRGR